MCNYYLLDSNSYTATTPARGSACVLVPSYPLIVQNTNRSPYSITIFSFGVKMWSTFIQIVRAESITKFNINLKNILFK